VYCKLIMWRPTSTSTYRYDGLVRCIEKMAAGGTRRYIYEGEDIRFEADDTNTLLARYTHAALARVGEEAGRRALGIDRIDFDHSAGLV
jgi:hypothetical protein